MPGHAKGRPHRDYGALRDLGPSGGPYQLPSARAKPETATTLLAFHPRGPTDSSRAFASAGSVTASAVASCAQRSSLPASSYCSSDSR